MINDGETVGFKVLHPLLAASTVSVTMDVDRQQFCGMTCGTDKQNRECSEAQCPTRTKNVISHGYVPSHQHGYDFLAKRSELKTRHVKPHRPKDGYVGYFHPEKVLLPHRSRGLSP